MMSRVGIWLQRRSGDWQRSWVEVYQFLEYFFSMEAEEPQQPEEPPKIDLENLEVKAWVSDAVEGRATSASPPQTRECTETPLRQAFFEPKSVTPEKTPRPMAKVELAAEKRMQAQMAKTKKSKENDKSMAKVSKTKPSSKPKKSKTKKGQSGKGQSGGPMQAAMAEFFDEKREAGMAYRDIQKAWLASDQRAAIIADMPLLSARRGGLSDSLLLDGAIAFLLVFSSCCLLKPAGSKQCGSFGGLFLLLFPLQGNPCGL